MDVRTGLFGLAFAAAAILLGIAIWHTDGPAGRCEDHGGHYIVGPGGESACLDPANFLPMDDAHIPGKPRESR